MNFGLSDSILLETVKGGSLKLLQAPVYAVLCEGILADWLVLDVQLQDRSLEGRQEAEPDVWASPAVQMLVLVACCY